MKISTIKPEPIPGTTRPIPKITWNNKTESSYIEGGFMPQPDEKGYYDEEPPRFYEEQKRFLSEVDTRQGPILREVTHIIRLKTIDWSSEKKERKEYLIWYETWRGRNWLGIDIAPVTGHVEGMYIEQTKKLKLDPRTGEALSYTKGKRQETYYIPYSKKTVDQIIAGFYDKDSKDSVKYINNRDSIHYVVKFASEDSPAGQMRYGQRTEFSYEQFATWTFADLYKMATRPWGNQDLNYGPTMSSYK